jgi:TonB family protein
MTNLKLQKSSGTAIADTAALSAAQDAAPFAPLPSGAPENVDIQFTFDYNVFSGGSHPGTFRQF